MADDFLPTDSIESIEPEEVQDALPMNVMDETNLATLLPEEELKQIGERVVEEYKADISSRSQWEEKMAGALKLFSGDLPPKNWPWEGASNVHIPLMGVACLQFQARAYEALCPPKQTAKCLATDTVAIDQAKRCETWLNYQLHYQMEEWEEEMDRGLLVVAIFGSAYKKTYYDRKLKRPASRLLDFKEFVTPYNCKRLADAPRKMHVYPMTINDVKIYAADGGFINIDKIATPGSGESSSDLMDQTATTMTGIEPTSLEQDKPRTIIESHKLLDMNGDGIEEPYIVYVDYDTGLVLRIETRTYYNPVTKKEEVAEYFTDYQFIPNPESHYAIGFGHLLCNLNEAANSLINQVVDAGTLANLSGKTGFISKRMGFKKGDIELELGKFKEIDIPTMDDISKGIWQFKFNDASPVLFQLLGAITTYSKEIASISEGLLGKLPPSDTTATSMMAVMEQGLKVYSTIHKRLHRALRDELRKLFYMNSIYLDENEYAQVQDSKSGEMITFQSGRQDFMNSVDVCPSSDPNITSRAEKLMKAKEVYQTLAGNPLVMQNPFAMYEITNDYLLAMGVENVERFKLREAAQMMFQMMMGGMNGQGGVGGVAQPPGNEGVGQGVGGPSAQPLPAAGGNADMGRPQ